LKSVVLRGYRPSDLQAIFALDQICFAPPFRFSMRAMRQFAESRNALTVIAECDGRAEIAGFCIAHVEDSGKRRVAYIVTLDVAPEQRRRGLAQAMMGAVEQQARGAGCEAMELHVSVENEGAIAFYERLGYVRVRVVKSFYGAGHHAFLYSKKVAEDQNLKR
jgi:ribosomal-protein-alanine N-acetyltransferase